MDNISELYIYVEFTDDRGICESHKYPLERAKTVTFNGERSLKVSRISVYTEEEICKRTEYRKKKAVQDYERRVKEAKMNLLQKVLGEELAEKCIEEILERQRPDDSGELCKLMRTEIISKYIQQAGLSVTDVMDIESIFSDDETYSGILDNLNKQLVAFKSASHKLMMKILPEVLCFDMTPELITDCTKLTDPYKRTASKSEK